MRDPYERRDRRLVLWGLVAVAVIRLGVAVAENVLTDDEPSSTAIEGEP